MLSKIRIICSIFCFLVCVDVVYGNEINGFEDLLNKNISLEDKLEFLELIKNTDDHSFSKTDIDILMILFKDTETSKRIIDNVIKPSDEENYDEEELENKDSGKDADVDEINIKNKIRCTILEIFLKKDIDDSVFTQVQMTILAKFIVTVFALDNASVPSQRRFLSLKVLIKINMLKPNVDDEFSRSLRQFRFNEAIEEVADVVEKNPSIKKQLEAMFLERGNVWDDREEVERRIFEPLISANDVDSIYAKEDPKILYEYENYLLENIKYFYINDKLKDLVERAFMKSKYEEFKLRYIDAMFYLEMHDALIKILKYQSARSPLSQRALEVGMKLLEQIDVLYFKKLSTFLLEYLNSMYFKLENWNKLEEIEEKIKIVQSYISKHDDMEDIEYVVYNLFIPVKEKVKYLDYLVEEENFYFKKENFEFIKKVLYSDDLDIYIKIKIANILLLKSRPQDVLDMFTSDDMESLLFLHVEASPYWKTYLWNDNRYKTAWQPHDDVVLYQRFLNKLKGNHEIRIQQYYRFDLWRLLLKYIEDENKEDSIKKLAIKTSLDLLVKTRYFEEFSSSFLNTLKRISENEKASTDLRNISDYILHMVMSKKVSLRDGSCAFKFIL